MEELTSKAVDLEQGQLMSVTVAMSLLAYLQEFVRTMDSGLEMHQFVRVSRPFNYYLIRDNEIFHLQYVAPICLIPLMGE